VKNTPFILELCLTHPVLLNGQLVDLHHLLIDVSLLYDCDPCKPVSFIRSKPCEHKLCINDRGDQLSLNTRIKVLTSQHEDMLFRIKITLLEPKTKREFDPPLEAMSEPIKVISKPKQTRKRKRTPAQKRTLNDILVETVQRIEDQQKKQQTALERLVVNQKEYPAPTLQSHQMNHSSNLINRTVGLSVEDLVDNSRTTGNSTTSSSAAPWEHMMRVEEDFTLAVQRFLMSYRQLSSEDKPGKIRKVMRSCSARDGEQLSELLGSMLNSPAKPEIEQRKGFFPFSNSLNAGSEDGQCACPSCPYRQELGKIDQFYTEFLATEVPYGDGIRVMHHHRHGQEFGRAV